MAVLLVLCVYKSILWCNVVAGISLSPRVITCMDVESVCYRRKRRPVGINTCWWYMYCNLLVCLIISSHLYIAWKQNHDKNIRTLITVYHAQ